MAIGEPFASNVKVQAVVGLQEIVIASIVRLDMAALTVDITWTVPFDCEVVGVVHSSSTDNSALATLVARSANNALAATFINAEQNYDAVYSTTPKAVRELTGLTNTTLTKGQFVNTRFVGGAGAPTPVTASVALIIQSQQNSDNTVTNPL
jgi:hypothetical protein